jgi:hypothetical protein
MLTPIKGMKLFDGLLHAAPQSSHEDEPLTDGGERKLFNEIHQTPQARVMADTACVRRHEACGILVR